MRTALRQTFAWATEKVPWQVTVHRSMPKGAGRVLLSSKWEAQIERHQVTVTAAAMPGLSGDVATGDHPAEIAHWHWFVLNAKGTIAREFEDAPEAVVDALLSTLVHLLGITPDASFEVHVVPAKVVGKTTGVEVREEPESIVLRFTPPDVARVRWAEYREHRTGAQLSSLLHYGHIIPVSRGLTAEHVRQNFPGWTWNELIAILRAANVVVSRGSAPPKCRDDVKAVHFSSVDEWAVEWLDGTETRSKSSEAGRGGPSPSTVSHGVIDAWRDEFARLRKAGIRVESVPDEVSANAGGFPFDTVGVDVLLGLRGGAQRWLARFRRGEGRAAVSLLSEVLDIAPTESGLPLPLPLSGVGPVIAGEGWAAHLSPAESVPSIEGRDNYDVRINGFAITLAIILGATHWSRVCRKTVMHPVVMDVPAHVFSNHAPEAVTDADRRGKLIMIGTPSLQHNELAQAMALSAHQMLPPGRGVVLDQMDSGLPSLPSTFLDLLRRVETHEPEALANALLWVGQPPVVTDETVDMTSLFSSGEFWSFIDSILERGFWVQLNLAPQFVGGISARSLNQRELGPEQEPDTIIALDRIDDLTESDAGAIITAAHLSSSFTGIIGAPGPTIWPPESRRFRIELETGVPMEVDPLWDPDAVCRTRIFEVEG